MNKVIGKIKSNKKIVIIILIIIGAVVAYFQN